MREKEKTNNNEHWRELVITNRLGLHARAAAALVRVAQDFDSEMRMEKNGEAVDAKSVLSLISLECPTGTRVVIRALGADSAPAVDAVARLVENKFGEE